MTAGRLMSVAMDHYIQQHNYGLLRGDNNQQEGCYELEIWANAQRDNRPAEYRWRPLLNAAVWLTPTTRVH